MSSMQRSIGLKAAEGEAGELFLDAAALGGVGGFREAVGKREEGFLFGLFGAKTGLDEVDQDTVGAGLAFFGHIAHAPGDGGRQRHALTDGFFLSFHEASIHHFAPEYTM